jgi:FG-GAP-like repeat
MTRNEVSDLRPERDQADGGGQCSGLESFEGQGTGAAVADFGRDGKLDIYLTSVSGGASRLYHNNGDGTFTNIARQAGVALSAYSRPRRSSPMAPPCAD